MNHCRRCDSDYEKPGTCNCYAPNALPVAPILPWVPWIPYVPPQPWYPYPWVNPYPGTMYYRVTDAPPVIYGNDHATTLRLPQHDFIRA